jgi:hypothetical protein
LKSRRRCCTAAHCAWDLSECVHSITYLVDLHKADPHAALPLPEAVNLVEDCADHVWDHTLVLAAASWPVLAAHGVGLAAACLAICKDCGIVAFEQAIHKWCYTGWVQLVSWLPKITAIHMIIGEVVLPCADLHGTNKAGPSALRLKMLAVHGTYREMLSMTGNDLLHTAPCVLSTSPRHAGQLSLHMILHQPEADLASQRGKLCCPAQVLKALGGALSALRTHCILPLLARCWSCP